MSQFKGVLVGLGNHSGIWNSTCQDHPEVDLVAYVARKEETRERAATQLGLPRDRLFASLGEAIDKSDPDFVLDVTPPGAHKEIALTSFSAGLSLLGEKPMSDTLEDAKEIVEAEKESGCVHMVAQQMRFKPQPRKARSLLEENTIGKAGQLDIIFCQPWADLPGSHYVNEPFMFLVDMGCHHFDMIRYVLDADAESAQVISWNPSWGWHQGDASHVAIFEFSDGFKAIHRAMGCSVGKKTSWTGDWRIEGDLGSLIWDDDRIFIDHDHRTDNPRHEEIPIEDSLREKDKKAVLDEFLSAVKEGREPECSGRDNLKTLAMTFAALKSAQEGRKVSLSELE